MRLLRDNGLTIVLMLLFGFSVTGHLIAGWRLQTDEAMRHGQHALTLLAYAQSAEFISSVFENWESEFLQMASYVMLTAVLFQKGSAESRDPASPTGEDELDAQKFNPHAPAVLRWGPLWRELYARSLGLALTALFIFSFVIHWTQSARAAAHEAMEHGESPEGMLAYLGDAQLWFESFQNWQSEFLSTAVLVVLSIFLRQRGSPESKPVAAPNCQTGP